jgi:DNA-binding NarL/FixJ family response regulator
MDAEGRITVLVADDHLVVRQGLTNILKMNPRIEVLGEVGDGVQLIKMATELHPDVVLLDLKMPELGGIDAVRSLLASGSKSRFITLTAYEEEEYMLEALRAGVHGYLLKDVDAEALNRAIETVAHGEMVLDPRVSKTVQEAMGRSLPASLASKHGLTSRETEVIGFMLAGLCNEAIAERLFISRNTLKFHIKNIYLKLGVSNRQEAMKALEH